MAGRPPCLHRHPHCADPFSGERRASQAHGQKRGWRGSGALKGYRFLQRLCGPWEEGTNSCFFLK